MSRSYLVPVLLAASALLILDAAAEARGRVVHRRVSVPHYRPVHRVYCPSPVYVRTVPCVPSAPQGNGSYNPPQGNNGSRNQSNPIDPNDLPDGPGNSPGQDNGNGPAQDDRPRQNDAQRQKQKQKQQTHQGNTALIEVHLPDAEAELRVAGSKTSSTGTTRTFESPELQVGKRYSYTLEATWEQDGRTITRKLTLTVSAGKTVTADFTRGPAPERVPLPAEEQGQ